MGVKVLMPKYIDAYAFRRRLDGIDPFTKCYQDTNVYLNYAKEAVIVALDAEPEADVRHVVKAKNIGTDYAECDQFVCSNCGVELQDWHRVERDDDDGDITYHEYVFRYCPNCGAVVSE